MKVFLIAFIAVAVIVAGLAGVKALQVQAMQQPPPPMPATVVTSAIAEKTEWGRELPAIGSLVAVQGVMVSAEVSGLVKSINFESGAEAKKGDLLVQLDISNELARQRAAKADVDLAQRELERAKALLKERSISTAEVDSAEVTYTKAMAELESIDAAIADRTIRAPFDGRLGIRLIDLGEVIEAGTPIVSLQSLDPIHVNFSLPQQRLASLKTGLEVQVTTDAHPGRVFKGQLTAINADLDERSRSIPLQATLANSDASLRPGMFAQVSVLLEGSDNIVMIPATAVLYSPFGDSVFVIEEVNTEGEGEDPSGFRLKKANVRIGETRGDFVAVENLEPGMRVVSTGVFKMTDGMNVKIDNSLAPEFLLDPKPSDS